MGQAPTIGWRSHALRLNAAVAAEAGRPAHAGVVAALAALTDGRLAEAVRQGERAAGADPGCAVAWRLVGLAHEARGDAVASLEAYQKAHELTPAAYDVLADLGRLASTMGMHEVAAELIARALAADPGSPDLARQLATALGDSHQYGKAIGVLSGALAADPHNTFLLDGLGAVLLQQGDTPAALDCFERALATDPDQAEPRFHSAQARYELGDLAGARADCDALLPQLRPEQAPAARYLRAQIRLSQGDLIGGWADYDARLDPLNDKAPAFSVAGRRLGADERVTGRRVLVMGEQGLGDEMMFAGAVPDLLADVGASGRVHLAVSPRLVALFARSFPTVEVSAYRLTTIEGRSVLSAPDVRADFWTPIGDLAGRYRSEPADFAGQGAFLSPDPARVAHWRGMLAALDDRPKLGLTWKSMKTYGHRLKQYPQLHDWAPVFRLGGVRFVNLQYGDCDADLAVARGLGAEVWRPPGLDLTNDIDEAAAFSAALDLAVGVGNASINLAAAVGTPAWIVCPPAAWPKLGTGQYPWFAQTRVFSAPRYGDWAAPLEAVARAVQAR